jgi:peptide/nickel transport system substrate-binding protein
MDRADATNALFNSLSAVPNSYLAPDHPLTMTDLETYPYDITKGIQLLDGAGWKDLDNDPATPRVAQGVAGVSDGTVLVVNYAATEATIRQEYAKKMATSLAGCGIQVNITATSRDVLYAAAPDGLLFGRKFDLAEFAWAAGREPPCFLYMSNEIPNAGNSWLGAIHGGPNAMGYTNPELDDACIAAQQSGLDETTYIQSQQQVMRILAEELPSIPLFYFVKIAVSRPDFCGMGMDVSTRSEMWNLENFDYGNTCQAQ